MTTIVYSIMPIATIVFSLVMISFRRLEIFLESGLWNNKVLLGHITFIADDLKTQAGLLISFVKI